jgi:hypothetical protein
MDAAVLTVLDKLSKLDSLFDFSLVGQISILYQTVRFQLLA